MNGESHETHCNSDGMRADNSMRRRGRCWSGLRFQLGSVGSIRDTGRTCAASGGCIHPHACPNENTCLEALSRQNNANGYPDIIDAFGIHTKAKKASADDHREQHKHELKWSKFWIVVGIIGFGVFFWLSGWYVSSDRDFHARSKPAVVPQHDVVHPVQKR